MSDPITNPAAPRQLNASEPVFRRIPTSRIRPNPRQPRHFIPTSAVEAMAISLKTIGQRTTATVRPLTQAERADDPHHDVELVGGHIRHAGALKAGLATLDCLIYDYTPEEAELSGLLDNQSTDMFWLDWVIAIENLSLGPSKLTQQAIADKLGFTQARVNYALKTAKALTPASREFIYNRVIKLTPEEAITEKPVRALAGLTDPQLVEKALPVFLNLQLNEPQAQQLVAWVKAGNPPETFTVQKTPKTKSPKTNGEPGSGAKNAKSASLPSHEVLAKVVDQTRQATLEEIHVNGQTAAQDQLKATLDEIKAQTAPTLPGHTPAASKKGETSSAALPPIEVLTQLAELAEQSGMEKARGNGTAAQEKFKTYFDEFLQKHYQKGGSQKADKDKTKSLSFFWEWVAGISFIGQIRSKLKKGEPLSGGEKFLVGAWRLMTIIGWGLKHGFKLLREAVKIGWKLLKKADKFVEKLLGKKISNWVRWAVAILFIWGLWVEYHHNPLHQLKVLVSRALSTARASSPVEISPKGNPAPPRMVISSPQTTGISSSVAAQPTPVEEAVSTAITASGKKMKMASPAVQPTASPQVTPVKKTDIAGDVLKAAPAGVDVAKKLFGL